MVCCLDPSKRQLDCLGGLSLFFNRFSDLELLSFVTELSPPFLCNLPLLQFDSPLPWTWEQCVPLNCWWPPTILYVATVPKTTIQNFMARRPRIFYFNCVSQGCSQRLTYKEVDFSCKFLHVFGSVTESPFFWDIPLVSLGNWCSTFWDHCV